MAEEFLVFILLITYCLLQTKMTLDHFKDERDYYMKQCHDLMDKLKTTCEKSCNVSFFMINFVLWKIVMFVCNVLSPYNNFFIVVGRAGSEIKRG